VKRTVLAVGAVGAFLALLGLFVLLHPSTETSPADAPPSARSIPEMARAARTTQPVFFVGLDGADWQLLDRYMADGAMPNLARLVAEGAGGILDTQHPPLSPLVWTTMMTGLGPLDHGILDFSRFSPVTGVKEPITSDERQEPAVWNMASWAGRRVVVLGLWATYPAEQVNGLIISDRLFTFLYKEDQPPPGVVFPPEAEPGAREVLQRVEDEVGFATLREYLPWLDGAEFARHRDTAEPYGHPVSALQRILVETGVYHTLGVEAIRRESPDLAIIFVQGTDSIGHVFAPFAPPRQPEITTDDFERYHGVPERYFQHVDRLLGEYRELAEASGAVLMLASDHGFKWSEGRPTHLSSFAAATAAKWHRKEGMYLLWGPGIDAAPGHPYHGGVAQVAATLLELLGLAPGRRLALPPLPPVPDPAVPKIDYRARYHRSEPVVGSQGADAEALAKLRALGYIGEDESTSAPEAVRQSGSTRTAGSFNNEGVILKTAGKKDEAIAAFEKALEVDPNLASAAWNLSDLLYAREPEWDRSDELLVRAFANGLPRGTKFLVGRAIGYQRAGREERSLRLMEAASRARADEPEVWLFLGRYQIEVGRCDEATDAFRNAIRLSPDNPAAHASLGLARMCAGDPNGARVAFRRSLDLDPQQPRVREFLKSL
jgi:Flp pilus assembly protein TadD/predicted AlkP superfamily pyrophosphatase or phosphodiesterase